MALSRSLDPTMKEKELQESVKKQGTDASIPKKTEDQKPQAKPVEKQPSNTNTSGYKSTNEQKKINEEEDDLYS